MANTFLARSTPTHTMAMLASGMRDEERLPIVTYDHMAELPSAASGARWGRSFHSLGGIWRHHYQRQSHEFLPRNCSYPRFPRWACALSPWREAHLSSAAAGSFHSDKWGKFAPRKTHPHTLGELACAYRFRLVHCRRSTVAIVSFF